MDNRTKTARPSRSQYKYRVKSWLNHSGSFGINGQRYFFTGRGSVSPNKGGNSGDTSGNYSLAHVTYVPEFLEYFQNWGVRKSVKFGLDTLVICRDGKAGTEARYDEIGR